jgi:hypothetical protein
MGAATLAQTFVDTVNAGDTTGFLAMFDDGGYVDDWGRKFNGPVEIRRWSDIEFIGARGQMTAVHITDSGNTNGGNTVTVVAQWTSDQHTGPSRFVLQTRANRLTSMTITAA